MGEVSRVGACMFTHSLNGTLLAQHIIHALNGCGWKLAGIFAAVGVPFFVVLKTNLDWIALIPVTFGFSRPSSSMISMLIVVRSSRSGTRTQSPVVTQMT